MCNIASTNIQTDTNALKCLKAMDTEHFITIADKILLSRNSLK